MLWGRLIRSRPLTHLSGLPSNPRRPDRSFETRSFPTSLAATLRGFAFYLADPSARLCQTPTPRTMKGTSPAQMLIHLLSHLENG